jgi:hypothetical protein
MNNFFGSLVILLISVLLCHLVTANKWKDMDMEQLEKEFARGDERAELEEENERISRMVRKNMHKYDDDIKESSKKAFKKHPDMFGGGVGGSLIFVTVHKNKEDGEPRTQQDMEKLSAKYNALLKTGGHATEIRNTDINVLMFNVHRGWMAKDIMRFLAMQPEVEFFTADGKKYYPVDIIGDDDEDDDDEL